MIYLYQRLVERWPWFWSTPVAFGDDGQSQRRPRRQRRPWALHNRLRRERVSPEYQRQEEEKEDKDINSRQGHIHTHTQWIRRRGLCGSREHTLVQHAPAITSSSGPMFIFKWILQHEPTSQDETLLTSWQTSLCRDLKEISLSSLSCVLPLINALLRPHLTEASSATSNWFFLFLVYINFKLISIRYAVAI